MPRLHFSSLTALQLKDFVRQSTSEKALLAAWLAIRKACNILDEMNPHKLDFSAQVSDIPATDHSDQVFMVSDSWFFWVI